MRYGWSSSNWSGYARYSERPISSSITTPFAYIRSEWIVPAIPDIPTDEQANVLVWIGIDGFRPSSNIPFVPGLIQVGTIGRYDAVSKNPVHFGWFQIITSSYDTGLSEIKPETFSVKPGNYIIASIHHDPNNTTFDLELINVDTGQKWKYSNINFDEQCRTTEFIVERGAFNPTNFHQLADYGEITFFNCIINGTNPKFSVSDRGYMFDPNTGEMLFAVPSIPSQFGDSFTVAFQNSIIGPNPPEPSGTVGHVPVGPVENPPTVSVG